MIPVRVPRAAVPVLATEREFTELPPQLVGVECLACGEELAPPYVLVYVGRAPDRTKTWDTGGSVPVHKACTAGALVARPATRPEPGEQCSVPGAGTARICVNQLDQPRCPGCPEVRTRIAP